MPSCLLFPSGYQKALTPVLQNCRYSFFAIHHWYLLSLKGTQCCLRASQQCRKPPFIDKLAAAVLCLLFTCPHTGWCTGKEAWQELPIMLLLFDFEALAAQWRTSRHPTKRAESHSWSCSASQPKLWLFTHLHFLLAYAFVAQYPT